MIVIHCHYSWSTTVILMVLFTIMIVVYMIFECCVVKTLAVK